MCLELTCSQVISPFAQPKNSSTLEAATSHDNGIADALERAYSISSLDDVPEFLQGDSGAKHLTNDIINLCSPSPIGKRAHSISPLEPSEEVPEFIQGSSTGNIHTGGRKFLRFIDLYLPSLPR